MKKISRVFALVLALALALSALPPATVKAVGDISATLSAGETTIMVVKQDGSLWGWGNNYSGVLDSDQYNQVSPVKVMDGVKSVSMGTYHALAVKQDGSLWAWGENARGQLGGGIAVGESTTTPIKVMDGVRAVAAGLDSSFVIKQDGTLWAWGWNQYGQLGDGTKEDRHAPVQVMANVASVAVHRLHTMVVQQDGSLWSFGDNYFGQLGTGDTAAQATPVKIMDGALSASIMDYASAILKKDGTVWTCGAGGVGQLGNGTDTMQKSPVKVLDDVVHITAGDESVLAIRSDNSLWAWGNNWSGQLGNGSTDNQWAPVKVLDDVADVTAGAAFAAAVKLDGTLWTWGENGSGQLGTGDTTKSLVPVQVLSGAQPQNATATIVGKYLYDTVDPGASIVLDPGMLYGVNDQSSAVAAVKSAAAGLSTAQKQSATGADLLTLFAEEAVAQAASVSTNSIVVNQASVTALEAVASSTAAAAEQALTAAGITVARELSTGVKFKTDATGPVTITVEASGANTTADAVKIDAPDYCITLSRVAIAANTADGPLVITVTPPSGTSTAVSSALMGVSLDGLVGNNTDLGGGSGYRVEANKPMAETIKFSTHPTGGDPNYQAIVTSDGTAVGGKYNPATGMLEAKTSASGTFTVVENKKDFSDIATKSAEMQEAIRILASKGIINGTSATTFGPDGSITRAEIAALVVRTLSKLDANADGGFTDVKKSDWYYGAVGSAKRHGIVNGTSATTFAPRSNIQKDQIVAICARTLKSEMKYKSVSNTDSYLKQYSDKSSLPSWALGDIALATRENLVVRRSDGNFNPSATMTRGDAAIILYRMFSKIW